MLTNKKVPIILSAPVKYSLCGSSKVKGADFSSAPDF